MRMLPPPRRRRVRKEWVVGAVLGTILGTASVLFLAFCGDPPPLPPPTPAATATATATSTPQAVLAVTPIPVVTVTPTPRPTPDMGPGHLGSGGLLGR